MVQAVKAPPAPTKTLQELVLAVHFQTPLPLGLMDVADWVGRFQDHPIVQQLDPVATLNLPAPGLQPVQLEMVGMSTSLPRMMLRSPDGRFSLRLQADRFALGDRTAKEIKPLGRQREPAAFLIID